MGSNFKIFAPQCSTHYTPDGRGDVLDTVVHQNVRLSEVTVADQQCLAFWTLLERGKL
jgi:hypothetical protein